MVKGETRRRPFVAPEQLVERLRRVGLGPRVIKSALAAGLAWEIGNLIHADPVPVLAPVTAFFTIQLTLAKSIGGAVQRVLGVVLGVSVALLSTLLFGVNGLTIGVVVLVSIVLGLRLRLESSGVEQMCVSALLVTMIGTTTRADVYASLHLVDTLVGTVVGLALNLLILPPNYVPAARKAVNDLGELLVGVLDDLSTGLAGGITAERAKDCLTRSRSIAAELDDARVAIDRAQESLRFNAGVKRQTAVMDRLRRANQALEHAAVQTRVISRTVSDAVTIATTDEQRPAWLEPEALGSPLANLFSAIALYLEHFLRITAEPADARDERWLFSDVSDRRRDVEAAARAQNAGMLPAGWALTGEIVSIADQLVADLTAAAAELG